MNVDVFRNEEFGEIRTVTIDSEPWFVGKDVAKALGYENSRDAIRIHIDKDDLSDVVIHDGSQNRHMTGINESGLYSLILGSKLESAKRFKRWVTSEVLPSIRKNGGYISGQETMSDDELMAKALMVAQNKISEKNQLIAEQNMRIEQMRPKEIFADAVATSKTSILVGELAKLICQNGYEIGQRRLFEWLRANGYLMKNGNSYNMPMQRFVEQGLFEIKESNIQNPDGSVRITKTTKITGKGQVYFINKFISKASVQ